MRWLVIALLVAAAASPSAACPDMGPWVLPYIGELPSSPTLVVHANDDAREVTATSGGNHIPHVVSVLQPSAFRIDVRLAAGPLEIRGGGRVIARYTVRSDVTVDARLRSLEDGEGESDALLYRRLSTDGPHALEPRWPDLERHHALRPACVTGIFVDGSERLLHCVHDGDRRSWFEALAVLATLLLPLVVLRAR